MGIRPSRFYAEIVHLSRLAGIRPMSDKHFTRVRLGRSDLTSEKIRFIVAAARSLSRLPIRASELFDVEPATGPLAAELMIGHPDPARGRTASLSVFWAPRNAFGSAAMVSQDRTLLTPGQVLESLYHEHGSLMLAVARVQWSLPEAEAEAVVHDVFLSFLERQPQVQNVRAFLLGATRNACRHYWRKRGRETELPSDLPDLDEDRRQQRWALVTTLTAALAQVGPRCRETLRSFYGGDENPAEIAKRLSVTTAYVYQILHDCRERVREIVSRSKKDVA